MIKKLLDKNYFTNGWVRINLINLNSLKITIATLEKTLSKLTNKKNAKLHNYHNFVDDIEAKDLRWKLTNTFWKYNFAEKICLENIDIFKNIMGPNLHIQSKPYLRIARPNKPNDNIGYHRDTYYGQSPYEVTFHIPLTKVTKHGALKFVSNSHIKSEKYYKPQKKKSSHEKGSKEHLMGFPYAPIEMEKSRFVSELRPVPLKIGQGILFSPSTIHGQEINTMITSRFSFDLRLINSNAPVKFKKDLTPRGYKKVCESAIDQVAEKYIKVNQNDN